MEREKRNIRTYKVADKPYFKAQKRQKLPPLATLLEQVVTHISDGGDIYFISKVRQKKTLK